MQFTLKSFHDIMLSALCPHQVDFLNLFFIVDHPPVPLLEQSADKHRVVTFTNVHFVAWHQIFILIL